MMSGSLKFRKSSMVFNAVIGKFSTMYLRKWKL